MATVCILQKQAASLDLLPAEIAISNALSQVTIGRNPENTFHADDKTISKFHCKFELKTTKSQSSGVIQLHLYVSDSSTFGTFVDNEKLGKGAEPRLVKDNAIIALRRPKPHEGFFGDYKVSYNPGMAPLGDEVIIGDANEFMNQLQQQRDSAPPQPAAAPLVPAQGLVPMEQQQQGSLRPFQNLNPLNPGEAPGAPNLAPPQQLQPLAGGAPAAGPQDIMIPMNLAGFVVGAKGENIRYLCETSGARLEIGKSLDAQEHAMGLKKVRILDGTPEQIEHAKRLIDQMISDENLAAKGLNDKSSGGMMKGMKGGDFGKGFDKGYKGPGYGGGKGYGGGGGKSGGMTLAPKPGAEVIHTQLEMVGLIIGRHGETINKIKEETGCEIEIGHEPGNMDPDSRIVQILGETFAKQRAKQIIDDLLKEAHSKRDMKGPMGGKMGAPGGDPMMMGKGGGMGKGGKPQRGGEFRYEREIPSEVVGLLIGKGGETIRKVQQESGCFIEVDKTRGTPGVTQMVIFESSEQAAIDRANAMMEEIVRPALEARQNNQGGGGASGANQLALGSGDGQDMLNNMANDINSADVQEGEDGKFRCQFPIEQELVRWVIGKGGDTIRDLGARSQTMIEILKQPKEGAAEGEEEHVCVIKGDNPGSVEQGRKLVHESMSKGRGKGNDQMGGPGGMKGGGGMMKGGNDMMMNMGFGGKGGGKFGGKKGEHGMWSPANPDFEDSCKIYVDEIEFPRAHYPNGPHPEEKEVFVRGLQPTIGEPELWEALCGFDAKDVQEILLIKDQEGNSLGCAYVLFQSQQSAKIAIEKLSARPLLAPQISSEFIRCEWSESDRILRGKEGSYADELIGKMMGKKGQRMHDIGQQVGARRVLLTGKGLKGHGQVDDDARLHLVVICEKGRGPECLNGARAMWTEQLNYCFSMNRAHASPTGQSPHLRPVPLPHGPGGAVHYPPGTLPPTLGPPPPGAMVLPPGAHIQQGPVPGTQIIVLPPGAPPPAALPVNLPPPQVTNGGPSIPGGAVVPTTGGPRVMEEAPPPNATPQLKIPLVLKRIDLETQKPYCEAVALLGSELRWQPWCKQVGGENWKAYPLRWGKEGQLFVILQNRLSGQIRLCVVDEALPMEEWKCVVAPPVELFSSKGCKFKPFNINGESFLICMDRIQAKLVMYKIADPNEKWETCYDQPLNDPNNPESMPFSCFAKIQIVYCPLTRKPYVVVCDRRIADASGNQQAVYDEPVLYEILDGRKPWRKVTMTLPLPTGPSRTYPVYMRTRLPGQIECFLFCVDMEQKELLVIYVPREGAENQWHIVWRKSMSEDTRLSLIYIAGKPEPMAMGLSLKHNSASLFKVHLHCVVPPEGLSADQMAAPQKPVMEEIFKRRIDDLMQGHPAFASEGSRSVELQEGEQPHTALIPVDTSADLACSQVHPWMAVPLKENAHQATGLARESVQLGNVNPFEIGNEPGPFGARHSGPDDLAQRRSELQHAVSQSSPFLERGPFDNVGPDGQMQGPFHGSSPFPNSSNGSPFPPPAGPFDGPHIGGGAESGPFDQQAGGPNGGQQQQGPFDQQAQGLLVGDRVEANFRRKGRWYLGTVVRVNIDHNGYRSYDVEYDEALWGIDRNVWDHNVRAVSFKMAEPNSWRGPKDLVIVQTNMVGLIIGNKGATVKEIERETKCKVSVAPDETGVPDGDPDKRVITIISDDPKHLASGKSRVENILKQALKRMEEQADRRKEHEERRKREAEDRENRDNKRGGDKKGRRPSRSRSRNRDGGRDAKRQRRDSPGRGGGRGGRTTDGRGGNTRGGGDRSRRSPSRGRGGRSRDRRHGSPATRDKGGRSDNKRNTTDNHGIVRSGRITLKKNNRTNSKPRSRSRGKNNNNANRRDNRRSRSRGGGNNNDKSGNAALFSNRSSPNDKSSSPGGAVLEPRKSRSRKSRGHSRSQKSRNKSRSKSRGSAAGNDNDEQQTDNHDEHQDHQENLDGGANNNDSSGPDDNVRASLESVGDDHNDNGADENDDPQHYAEEEEVHVEPESDDILPPSADENEDQDAAGEGVDIVENEENAADDLGPQIEEEEAPQED